ncbi:MAG: ABC transporter ATP-binding protein [Chloroflexi bacterium]|nr:ABC transporter ATP-binding protein [Chloroflexota bacterium]
MTDVQPIDIRARRPASGLAVETRELTKWYGRNRGILDVSLEVPRGEIFGFLGPNGSGKSTTIRLLLDLIRPSAGTARVLDLDVATESLEIRHRTGYVPGELALYGSQSGTAAIRYFAGLRGGIDTTYAFELAERFRADLDRPIGKLSTGNKHKVAIVLALMHKPELLVLDEPSTGLDPLVQQEFQAVLRETRDEGRTVFLSSHTLAEVERVTDRVGIIREGRLVVVERLSDLKAKAVRHLEFEFDRPVPAGLFDGVEGVRDIRIEGRVANISVEGMVDPAVRAASALTIVNISSVEADLDEIFLAYYRGETDAATPSPAREVTHVG